jgi:hypothetical protein
MTAPQSRVMRARWIRGPTFRMRIVEGGWKMMYGMKKTRLAMF